MVSVVRSVLNEPSRYRPSEQSYCWLLSAAYRSTIVNFVVSFSSCITSLRHIDFISTSLRCWPIRAIYTLITHHDKHSLSFEYTCDASCSFAISFLMPSASFLATICTTSV